MIIEDTGKGGIKAIIPAAQTDDYIDDTWHQLQVDMYWKGSDIFIRQEDEENGKPTFPVIAMSHNQAKQLIEILKRATNYEEQK